MAQHDHSFPVLTAKDEAKAIRPIIARWMRIRTPCGVRRTINLYTSCLISWRHPDPDGGAATGDGRHGERRAVGRMSAAMRRSLLRRNAIVALISPPT